MTESEIITGVRIKELVSHPDQRGFFREVVRCTDDFFEENGFAQWSHSKMTKNVVKAWHYHHLQVDWWYIPIGFVEAVLFDNREESPSYKTKMVIPMGEADKYDAAREVCVKIPQGVLHGLKVISDEAHIFYITSQTYDGNDEGRFPFNSELVNHDWGVEAITSEKDKIVFEPTATRIAMAL